jgi:hypothetical protein
LLKNAVFWNPNDVANEARDRVRRAYAAMDEIDNDAGLSREQGASA